jgi:hypothetical protein
VSSFPRWRYFPSYAVPPRWVGPVIQVFSDSQHEIDSTALHDDEIGPDYVRRVIAPGLAALGFAVDASKKQAGTLPRAVLIGDQGKSLLTYEVDAYDAEHGIALEVEPGHATIDNAIHRDLIQASLTSQIGFLALVVPIEYRYAQGSITEPTYAKTHSLLETIYGSPPSILPFEGLLLIGY